MQTLEQFASARSRALSELPFIGRSRELGKLAGFAGSKTPALLCGLPGMGRTRLFHELAQRLPADGMTPVYIRFRQPLHAFLLEFAKKLSVQCAKSSISLRGALWSACETGSRVFLIDDISEATLPYYRFLSRVLANKDNAIIGATVHEHATGALQRIFWNQHSIVKLPPFNRAEAEALIGAGISAFLSNSEPSPDFANRVLQAARGNPGRIVEMCIRAADPAYRTGDNHIRFGALVMDSVTRLL